MSEDNGKKSATEAGIGQATALEKGGPQENILESKAARRLAWFAQVLGSLRAIVTNVLLLAVLIVIGSAAVWEARRDTIVLDPIEVPKDLAERGYSSVVVAQRLNDEIRAIQEARSFRYTRKQIAIGRLVVVSAGLPPDIQVPGSGVSIRSAVRYAKEALGFPETHIGGDITREGKRLKLMLRSPSQSTSSVAPLRRVELEELLTLGAQEVVKMNQPCLLASYFYKSERKGGDFKKTEDMVRYCLANGPEKDHRWAYIVWGLVLYQQDNFEEAIKKYKLALGGELDFALPYAFWGEALEKLGKDGEAMEKYRKATEIDPKDAASYTDWGNVLDRAGRDAEAIEKYKKAIEIAPREAVLYSNWCNSLNMLGRHEPARGRYEAAIEKCREAIEIDPNYAPSYHNWGVALEELKKYEEAIEKYKKALEIDPKLSASCQGWGNALMKLGKDKDADSEYQRACHHPRRPA